ncbi:MAG: tetratricopeptide repeat protein, partial [Elusimicrobia bacterium]|nr:tetratricopeptide repeat protein [Elusimicrobiota bacterium]
MARNPRQKPLTPAHSPTNTASECWFWSGAVFLAVLMAFAGVVRHEFVAWDDDINVYQNPLLNPATLEGVKTVWTSPYLRLYIPLTYTAWSAVAAWCQRGAGAAAQLSPMPFHAANLAVHLLTAIAAYFLLRRVLQGTSSTENGGTRGFDRAAALGALLFSLHPIQVEPVAWISGLRDVMSGLGAVLALSEYVAFTTAPDRRRAAIHYGLATLALAAAFLCKPSAVVVPVMAGIIDLVLLGRSARKAALPVGIWLALAAGAALLTQSSQGATHIRAMVPLWARPLIAADSVAFYLWKLLWPFNLSIDYSRSPDAILVKGWPYYTWIAPAAAALRIWFTPRRRIWGACGALFVAGVLPVLGFVPFLHQDMSTVSDRYLYLSMLGPALAIAWAAREIPPGSRYWTAAGALIVGLGILSRIQTQVWKNTGTLFSHAVALNPDNGITHLNLGNYMSRQGNKEEAKRHYLETLRLRPGDALALKNMGGLLVGEGKLDEAAGYFTQALEHPNREVVADAQNALGVIRIRQGRITEGAAHHRLAVELQPNRPDSRMALADALSALGKWDEAIVYYEQALYLAPQFVQAHNGLGYALLRKGNIDGAIARWSQALEFAPNYLELRHNLGLALLQKGRREESIAQFRAALTLQPGF